MRRILSLTLVIATGAAAQSHPASWNFASPDASSLVGIRWQAARNSLFAEALAAQLGAAEGLGLPDFGLLDTTQQIFLSGPYPLAVLTGKYSLAKLKAEGHRRGFIDGSYRGVPILVSTRRGVWSVALLNEWVILAGDRKVLHAALDRANYESGAATPPSGEHPLFARAAALHHKYDFWILAKEYPDELAGEFVPLEDFGAISSIDGGVSFRNGVTVEAQLGTGSEEEARRVTASLKEALPDLPAVAREMKIQPGAAFVRIQMQISEKRLAELTNPRGEAEAVETASAAVPRPSAATSPKPEANHSSRASAVRSEEEKPVTSSEAVEAAKPQVIRIFGLEEGVREIPLGRKPSPSSPPGVPPQ